jgi:hypothetical protein
MESERRLPGAAQYPRPEGISGGATARGTCSASSAGGRHRRGTRPPVAMFTVIACTRSAKRAGEATRPAAQTTRQVNSGIGTGWRVTSAALARAFE